MLTALRSMATLTIPDSGLICQVERLAPLRRRSNNALCLELVKLLRREAQKAAVNLLIVFAGYGCRSFYSPGCARHLYDNSRERNFAYAGIFHINEHLSGCHLGIIDHFRNVVHPRTGHPGLFQNLDGLVNCLVLQPLLHHTLNSLAILITKPVVLEPGVFLKILPPDGSEESPPNGGPRGTKHHPTVLGLEAVGGVVVAGIALCPPDDARDLVFSGHSQTGHP